MTGERERGPVPMIVGRPAAWVYERVVARRNRAFDRGERVTRLDGLLVVSVGNLSVGGTGKTPTVMRVVEELRAMGRTPAVAMRGYGPKRGGLSDEQAEYLERWGGTGDWPIDETPVVAQRDRAAGIASLRSVRPDVDAVVLDDGFQHRFVRRDVDLVLLDARRDLSAERCLPAGWLREPPASLARASAVLLTRCDEAGAERSSSAEREARALLPAGAPVLRSEHAWTRLRVTAAGPTDAVGPERREPVDWLAGRHVVVAAGVGSPGSVESRAAAAGAVVRRAARVWDHFDWGSEAGVRVARRLVEDARAAGAVVLTTGKDWVKIRCVLGRVMDASRAEWVVPELEVRLEETGAAELRGLLASAAAGGEEPGGRRAVD